MNDFFIFSRKENNKNYYYSIKIGLCFPCLIIGLIYVIYKTAKNKTLYGLSGIFVPIIALIYLFTLPDLPSFKPSDLTESLLLTFFHENKKIILISYLSQVIIFFFVGNYLIYKSSKLNSSISGAKHHRYICLTTASSEKAALAKYLESKNIKSQHPFV